MKYTILTLLITPSLLLAQSSTDSTESAKKLASVIEIKKQFISGFDAMLPAITSQSEKLKLNAEDEAELIQIYRDWFLNDINQDDLEKQIIGLYAEIFTAAELNELIKFYKTPLGKKTLKALPEITKKSAMIGIKEGQIKQKLLMDRLKPFLEKYQNIEKDAAPNR